MKSTTIQRVGALGAMLLLAAACGGSGGEEDGVDDGGVAFQSGGTGSTSPRGGYYGGGGGGDAETGSTGAAGAGEASLTVALNNYLFDPAQFEVESGATIDVQNANANTPHTFTVKGTDLDIELAPLTSETAVIDLDPGSYDVICRFHTAFDMEATLTVT